MSKKNPILMGTLILTIAGFLTRILGLFYRIFLSRAIGSEGMGIYQLIFPIYTICFSVCSAGVQTAVSRYVAEKSSSDNKKEAIKILFSGLIISLTLSVILSVLLYNNADWIATSILQESRCGSLLRYLAYAIPLGAIHSGISGYYIGNQKAGIPAWSQLLEQIVRVGCVYLMGIVISSQGGALTPEIAVIGTVIGELGSAIFCIFAIRIDTLKYKKPMNHIKQATTSTFRYVRMILSMSIPLTLNRVMLNILQSAEAILVPFKLQAHGLTSSASLSIYGVLSGMAMPFIYFPSAITNSIAVMLLPAVAEAQHKGDMAITSTTDKSIKYSIILGIFCTGIFIVYGKDMGTIVFNNKDAGLYIMILSWLCPFLYITSTLGSILNGLGKTTTTFIHNMIATLIRIGFLIYFVPQIGIMGYLWGLLVSQLAISFLHLISVRKQLTIHFNVFSWILKPAFYLIASLATGYVAKVVLLLIHIPNAFAVIISALLVVFIYWMVVLKLEKQKIKYLK